MLHRANRTPARGGGRQRIAYQPGNSPLHRLHPLVKGVWLVGGTAALFVVRSPWPVVAAVAALLAAVPLSGLHLGRVRGIRLLTSTALLLGILQIAFVREGPTLMRLGPLIVSSGGVRAALYVAGRFLGVILLSYLFVLSTEPNDLAYALMRAGVPYRYGFALITALRLVPVFQQEGQIVYQAQLARGVQYDVRSPRRVLTLARQFILPLLISALGKVDVLAVSMEGRCFGKYPTRTFLREVRFTPTDGLALALIAVVLLGAIGFSVLA